MKRFTFLLLSFCLLIIKANFAVAQNSMIGFDSITVNGFNARVSANGTLFYDPVKGNPKCEWPAGSGKHISSAAHLWIGALDPAGQLRLAAQTYAQGGADVWAGPALPTWQSPAYQYDSLYDLRYNRVWKVTKAQVDAHIAQHAQPGYQMPAAIAQWPGNGLTINGEPPVIAPYADANGNFFYDPGNGDYPLIPGDEAIFCIFNDARKPHTETGGMPLNVDIRLMLYAFNAPQDTALHNTLFGSYLISNPAPGMALSDVAVGLWMDADLGHSNDDYLGTDSMLSAMYAYNGDANDDGPNGYGLNPPAFGMTLLNRPMSGAKGYWNDFSLTGNPEFATDYYGYLRNLWKDGSNLVNNGLNGYPNTAPGPDTDWHFPGDPTTSTGWTAPNGSNIPSDMRLLGQVRQDSLLPGQSLCLDVAWVAARRYTNDQFGSVTALKEAILDIRNAYAAAPVSCAAASALAVAPGLSKNTMRVYPNPATGGVVTLEGLAAGSKVQLCDIQGQLISQLLDSEANVSLSTAGLPQGLYLLRVVAPGGAVSTLKLSIVE